MTTPTKAERRAAATPALKPEVVTALERAGFRRAAAPSEVAP